MGEMDLDAIERVARKQRAAIGEGVNPGWAGRLSLENKTRLSWWFPRLPDGIHVPKTSIIEHTGDDLLHLLDGIVPAGCDELCEDIANAGDDFGWPLFLRTDYLSGKHGWRKTCHVPSRDNVRAHIASLVEESASADMMGFPSDRWIARRMIPTTPAFFAFHGDMPIVKERRYFVQGAVVVCHHPYWPPEAFDKSRVSVGGWRERLDQMNFESNEEVALLSDLSSGVGVAIGGDWSIDWLWSERESQWYLTDMAEAASSYHWSECSSVLANPR